MICIHCSTEFPDPQWPNTRQKVCSQRCAQAAYREKHRTELRERWKEHARKNRDRRLAARKKYNTSAKGKAAQARYQEKNRARLAREHLARYHADPRYKDIHLSRERARKALVRSGREQVCEMCPAVERLHCHHKNEDPMDNRLDNLGWLCVPCHNSVHSESIER